MSALIIRLSYADGSTYWYYDGQDAPAKDGKFEEDLYTSYDVFGEESDGIYKTMGRGIPPEKATDEEVSEVRHALSLFGLYGVRLKADGTVLSLPGVG